ncbi:hypothetical protein H5407_21365 [Mitsuaria sp. WAJ17]|uniref:hypothetical protein n=1 Tax=Mitsuaria sp. WAJ17 TaxID=2761452 RepID=UPI001603429E|nr:hypothetical protein [Mitsuaria sp. WAJ17]MBB2487794.1 hypothetical protein [Mitsuaria sp. WAJ17]
MTRAAGWPVAVLACFVALLGGCASPNTLRPFSTDGCSLYPDRAASIGQDWCGCCVAHDRAYWRGGSEADRLRADEALRACVLERTDDPARAATMFRGVRIGGSAWWPTPFRWGYGWGYGRYYRSLDLAESAEADRLEALYEAEVGFDQCPGRSMARRTPLPMASPAKR